MTETSTTNTAAVATLDRIRELLTQNPSLPTPYIALYDHRPDTADLNWYLHINGKGDAETQKTLARSIIRGLGGKWSKTVGDNDVSFEQERDGLSLQVMVIREAVCTRRVVGVETVTIAAVEAQPERTVEREVVEWDCAPLLADSDELVSA